MSAHEPAVRPGVPSTSASSQMAAVTKLKDWDFRDLNMSESGEAYFRGLDGTKEALAFIPDSVVEDMEALHFQICRRGQSLNEFFHDYDGIRFRVSRIEEVTGTWFTLRRLKWPIPRLGELGGIPPRVAQTIAQLAHPDITGLILVSGPTSQGKTTTACSILQEYLLVWGDVAVTVEDPVELPLSGFHGAAGHCLQTQVDNGDFEEAMKKTMRRAPRYILLGEVRSRNEASVALRAAINGHLVITTIHSGSCIEAIDSMIKLVAGYEPIELARASLANGLLAVTNQRLKRRPGGKGRELDLEYLFFPRGQSGSRSLVRSGKTEQLGTEIDRQKQLVRLGKPPVDLGLS